MYGKQTECAIASASRLAEVYDGGITRLNAEQLAEARGLRAPFVAKVLSSLSRAGIVSGTRGPGGGYTLARPPKAITLREIFDLFERPDTGTNCPFGGGICGAGAPCALHDSLVGIQSNMDIFLNETTLERFRVAYQELGHRPVPAGTKPKNPGRRESYRAPKKGK